MNFRNPVKTLCYGLVLGAACCVTLAPAAEAGAKADKHSEAWRRTHKALGQHLPRVEFIEVPLKDVLDFFRHVQDLPEVEIRPDWAALKRIGVTQATEANLDVRDLSVRRALELTMASTVGLGRIECVVGEDGLVHVRPAKAGPLPLPAKPTDKQLAARKRLAVKVANVDFRDAKLMDVITFLRDLSGVNIFVDWHSLGRIKVDHHSKVRLKLTDVPVRDALTGTLQAVTTKKALRWEVDTEGVVLIHALPAPPATRPAVWGLPVNGLQVGIRCKELRLKPESEVTLELSARNDGKKPLRLLRLDTYFWHNISSVSSIEFKIDGKVFRYCGPQLRPPAPPGVNAYISITPGAVHSAEVRIPLVNWGLNDPRGAEITFVYTNNRADAIASPFDQKTRKWKQVTGLWTGTARSGTIKLNQTEAQQRGTSREEARAREPVNGLSRTGAGEAATSEPVPQPDSENDASGAEKRDTHFWGNAVNGLQCRAWVDSKEIPFGLNLSVHYELRDAGNADIRVLRDDGYPHHVHVEWLDRKAQCSCEHKPPFMGDRIGAERFVTLKQGDTLRGRCSWWGRIESEHTEAVPEKASLRVTYFIFPEITKRYPGVWGPAPGQTDALRVSSNVVEVNLEPGLPGSRDRQNGGYSLEDAWLMADLVVQARVDSKPKPEKLVEAGYRDD